MAIDVFLSEEKIRTRVSELARDINRDYAGKEIVVVGVLNGAFIFVADLIRQLDLPITFDFIAASSYDGTESTGKLNILLDLKTDIKGKHVLLVEDIIDTGLTIKTLLAEFQRRGPASLKFCSLLFKPARNLHKVPIDYLAFEIEDKFVIGYGLDFNGRYRELPYIGVYSAD
jgi:hypoxanthine phosphoribosyltransferase